MGYADEGEKRIIMTSRISSICSAIWNKTTVTTSLLNKLCGHDYNLGRLTILSLACVNFSPIDVDQRQSGSVAEMRFPLASTPIYKKRFPSRGTHTLSMNCGPVGMASQNCANTARLAAYSTSCRPIGGRIWTLLIRLLCMRELRGHITSGGCYTEILPPHQFHS